MVKAYAYGHGIVKVAQSIEDLVDMFGVANIDEAKMWYRYAANLGYQPALSILRTLSAN